MMKYLAGYRAGWLAALLLVLLAGPARAVTVSPNALYIDHRTRSGMLTLYNPGDAAEDVEISFVFGYPRSDEQGTVSVVLSDEAAPEGEPSAVPWLRAFPRRIRLEPGQRQVVRVMVQPPAGLAPGEYWGRIRVRATGGQPPIEQRISETVTTRVEVATEIIAAINYRNGAVTTGVAVKGARAAATEHGVAVMMDVEREGNAAFLGRMRLQLVSPSGAVVAEAAEDLAVYRTLRRTAQLPLATMPASLAGYRVRYTFDATRPDLPPDGPLPAAERTGTVPVS